MQKSSGQSGPLLEERDYIGLSESSSVSSSIKEDAASLQDTDLRLGLGLGLGLASDRKEAPSRNPSSNSKKRGYSAVPRDAPAYNTCPSWHAGPFSSDTSSQDSATHDPPPPKGQIVGWPPVRSYRRQTLPKPAEMFVKVNMDGMTVGRKVDLSAYTSYESLLRALEEMFQPSGNRESNLMHFLLSNDPDFILTYEDKDGDWMLVGDVPWSMFTSTVRRLRITRGSEANGTALRRPQTQKSKF